MSDDVTGAAELDVAGGVLSGWLSFAGVIDVGGADASAGVAVTGAVVVVGMPGAVEFSSKT